MRQRLGELLLKSGAIHHEQLDEALRLQQRAHERIGQILLRLGYLHESELARGLAAQFNLAYSDLLHENFAENAAALFPEGMARRYGILPIKIIRGKLRIAIADPTDFYALEAVRHCCSMDTEVVIAAKHEIKQKSDEIYHKENAEFRKVLYPKEEPPIKRGTKNPEESSVVELVDEMIQQALKERASDIHIEPFEDAVRIRFRIDGILRGYDAFSKKIQPALISRLKIMGALDIAEKRVPQDGRIRYVCGGNEIDLRISTLPVVWGEKIALRILNKASFLTKISALGFSEENLALYRAMYNKSHGMLLIVGPTGSGKSTTLYTTLMMLNDNQKNIVTIENPIEYHIDGVNQIQTNEKAGLTFAGCLRAVLRQDPNIIMIGEIRDRETAEISIRASLTGHLVMSTLHTSDAAGTVFRLMDMDIQPFLIASSLLGIVAQRLVRMICPRCKTAYHPGNGSAERLWLRELYTDDLLLYKGRGCPFCAGTGYRGRIAVNEILSFDNALRDRLSTNRGRENLRKVLAQKRRRSMLSDGIEKMLNGVTTLEEVLQLACGEGENDAGSI